MLATMPTLYEQIRQAIAASDKSRYQIWQETRISQGQLSELMAGTKGLSVESIELLADCLDLEIIVKPKRSKRSQSRTAAQASRKGN